MNFVKPNGTAPARIMVVGDYPTEIEINNGFSFSGSSADTMDRVFKRAGMDLKTTWKTHYYKVAIPGWNSDKEAKKREALKTVENLTDWTYLMRREIEQIKPNLIVSCGELAMRGLTNHTNINKRAGSIYPLRKELMQDRPIRVLCIHTHRQIYVFPAEYRLTQSDLLKGKPYIDALRPWTTDYNLVIGKTSLYVRDWIKHFSHKAPFGVTDVETYKNLVTCLCFCFDGKNSLSVPLLDGSISRDERARMWYLVWHTLRNNNWVNQNIKYDWNRLEAMKFQMGPIIGDTMLRTSVIYPELPKGLDFLTRLYTDIGYYKDEGKEYDPKIHDFNRMLLYNAKDGIATHRVYTAQEKDIEAFGVKKVNANVQRAFFTYRRMEDNGIRIDDTERKKLIKFYDNEILLMESELDVIAGRKMNAKSGDQIGPLLIEMGADPKIRSWDEEKNKFKYKTGKVELEELFVHVSDTKELAYVAKLALSIRKMYKLRQFCDFVAQEENGILVARTSFKLHGAETGRSATGKLLESIYYAYDGEKPDWEQPGFSVQQQPKHPWKYNGRTFGPEFRRIFVPRVGYVFIEFDLSQAEARVVDVLAEDYESLEEYGRVDKHCKTAAIVNGLDYDELYRKYKLGDYWAKEERQKGKSYKHAFNYDESAYNLSRRAHIPYTESYNALRNIGAAHPRITNIFHRTVRNALETTRTLRTPYGRVRTFFGTMNEKTIKEGYAHIPQSTIPDHMRFDIMLPLEEIVRDWANFLVEWHDSLLSEVKIERAEEYKEHVSRLAKTPITFKEGTFIRDYELVIPIDIARGENWLEMEKF